MAKKRPTKCPKCSSKKSRSRGYRLHSDGSRAKDCECKNCGRRYTVRIK